MATDLKQLDEVLKGQFRNLSGVHPGLWPILPRMLLALGVAAVAVGAGYFLYWQSQYEELEAGAQKEVQLRDEFRQKVAQAVNLEELKRQKKRSTSTWCRWRSSCRAKPKWRPCCRTSTMPVPAAA